MVSRVSMQLEAAHTTHTINNLMQQLSYDPAYPHPATPLFQMRNLSINWIYRIFDQRLYVNFGKIEMRTRTS